MRATGDHLINSSPFPEPMIGKRHSEDMKLESSKRMMGNKHGEGTHYHGDLMEDQVRDILVRFSRFEDCAAIAKDYGVSPSTIMRIGSRKIWWRVHIPQDIELARQRRIMNRGLLVSGEMSKASKLTWESVETIRVRRRNGESYASIAKDFGVTFASIRNACIGRTWMKQVEILAPGRPS